MTDADKLAHDIANLRRSLAGDLLPPVRALYEDQVVRLELIQEAQAAGLTDAMVGTARLTGQR
jgi:hypothetical protein